LLLRLRLLLILFALCVFLPGLFTLPPGDRDESRFAQATKQMTETGNYTKIMNGTEPRNKKPIGIHWLQAPWVLAAGTGLKNPIWPYRIPSVLGGLAAVLAVFEIGLTLTRMPRIAAMAGLMFCSCVILATETHIAKPMRRCWVPPPSPWPCWPAPGLGARCRAGRRPSSGWPSPPGFCSKVRSRQWWPG
jgi:4-amino-4-deoxy-L-arabinose transferase-like glycosyltransferase